MPNQTRLTSSNSKSLKQKQNKRLIDPNTRYKESRLRSAPSAESAAVWADISEMHTARTRQSSTRSTTFVTILIRTFNLLQGIITSLLQLLFQMLSGTMAAFAPFIFATAVLGYLFYAFIPKSMGIFSFLRPDCTSLRADTDPLFSLLCGRMHVSDSLKHSWCHYGGNYITRGTCGALAAEQEKQLENAVGMITKTTYETADQGQQLVFRTQGLPEPKALAVRSTNLHSLQWAVLYHTNFTDKQRVADGLRTASNSLDTTVDALIELKGDAEFALRDMIDQFERIERALDATVHGRKTLRELEETFDESLKLTDDVLSRVQTGAVHTAELAKKTKLEVEQVRRLLSIQKRSVDVSMDKVAPGVLAELFCLTCLTRAQARQLSQDLKVWEDSNGEMNGLSKDLAILGVELGQFRHNVKLVRSSWRRTAWVKGDVMDQIESLRSRVAQLKALMDGRTTSTISDDRS